MKSAELDVVAQEIKDNLRKDLFDSDFDVNTIEKIMEIFDKTTAGCTFKKNA